MTNIDEEKLKEIWTDDRLERRGEAAQFINFIESVSERPQIRQDVSSFTISVDAGYGQGKTFFLKRVAEQMRENHPVAFVDAWQDDLADEPLTALIVTLQDALGELIEDKSDVRERWLDFQTKAWAITKIGIKGLAKKGASILFTEAGAEAAEAFLSGGMEEQRDDIAKNVGDIAEKVVEDAATALQAPAKLMQSRIDDFRAGKAAIAELKNSLRALLASLGEEDIRPPIVIFIDELDRCRPTYAVKLLEEIKHLFDVDGLVFVFGINIDQLAHSVAGAYGPGFDGRAYLHRFINRQYRLKSPEIENFVNYLIEQYGIDQNRFWFPEIHYRYGNTYSKLSGIIAFYLRQYEISVRSTINVFETLRTCCALTGKVDLLMPLLLPLILFKEKAIPNIKVFDHPETPSNIFFGSQDPNFELSWQRYGVQMLEYAEMGAQQFALMFRDEDEPADEIAQIMSELQNETIRAGNFLASPMNYKKLIETVGRYTSPINAN